MRGLYEKTINGKKYKVTISGDVKSTSEKTLGQEYVWTFSYLPPFVEKSYPNNSTNLGVNSSKIFPANKPIALLFNQKISTDELQKRKILKLKNDFNDILDEDDNSEEVLNNAVENLV